MGGDAAVSVCHTLKTAASRRRTCGDCTYNTITRARARITNVQLVYALIRQVDTQLLEAVSGEILVAKYVEDSNAGAAVEGCCR